MSIKINKYKEKIPGNSQGSYEKKKPHKEVLAIILKVTLSHCNETTQYKNKNKSVKKKGYQN